jgi:hypothetical protein
MLNYIELEGSGTGKGSMAAQGYVKSLGLVKCFN